MFKVIRKFNGVIASGDDTLHYINRIKRIKAYNNLLSFNMIDKFIVDTDHRNGLEIHCINEYGLIYIYNYNSLRLITILHPRPRQVKRYYKALELTVSKKVRDIIKQNHQRNIDYSFNEL